ncbi:lysozyme inhibitor LprI family protein [Ewingella allii]|uniref:lysozyme inhibitor LprI family protein n=1 Tax=Ewingella allii TaxID=3092550 RepID=UPI003793D29F
MKKLILLSLISFSALSYENCTSESTTALEICSYKNYKSEDVILNYLYNKIVTLLPKIKNEVKRTQILWIKARDEICKYSPDDGAEYKITQNACLYQQTYERNRELKAIIDKETYKREIAQPEPQREWNNYVKNHCEFMEKQFADKGCMDRNNFLHSDQ